MSSQGHQPALPSPRRRSSTPVNAVASGSRPMSSPSRPGPPPRRNHGPTHGMDVFEEPFPLEEEPADLHGEDVAPAHADLSAADDDGADEGGGGRAAAAAERDSMYVSLFEGQSSRAQTPAYVTVLSSHLRPCPSRQTCCRPYSTTRATCSPTPSSQRSTSIKPSHVRPQPLPSFEPSSH